MEYIKNLLKKTGWISLVESVIFAIIGLILICNPEQSIQVIYTILGIIFILAGAYKIFIHLTAKENGNVYDNSIVFGIMAIVIGIITMVFSKEITTLFSISIGVWIIYSSILRLSSSIRLKTISPASNLWIVSLVLSIIMLICGVYIVASAKALVATIGVFILIYAIIDICENLIFLNNVKNV